MHSQEKRFYEFEDFRLDAAERVLYRRSGDGGSNNGGGGEQLRMPPKTFEVLLTLIENANRVVGKEEIMNRVWADSFVEEANLTVHIAALRKIFGSANFIETVPKRGYRFIAAVREELTEADSEKDLKLGGVPASPPAAENENETGEEQTETNAAARRAAVAAVQVKEVSIDQEKTNVRKRRTIIFGAAISAILIGCAFAFYKFYDSRPPFQTMTVNRVLNTGKTGEAAISPDGKYLAHVVRDAGKQSLWIKHIGTNNSLQLIAPATVNFSPLTYSPDGGYVYYSLRTKDLPVNTLYRISVLGGEPEKVFENVAGAISFAPDGRRFAFVRNVSPDETVLMIADLESGEQRALAARRRPEYFSPVGAAWSPDGQTIACSGGVAAGERTSNIFAVSVADGAIRPLSDQRWRNMERVAWINDGSGLAAAVAEYGRQEGGQIWFFPFPSGEPRRITNDLNDYGGVSLAADSKTLVTVQFEVRRKIYLSAAAAAAGNNAANGVSEPVSLTDDMITSYRFVSWTPDNKILFPVDSSGSRDIWIMNADGSGRKQLTATEHHDILPAATPDGRYIVFASNRAADGAFNIWRMNADGSGGLVQLTFGKDESVPSVTPDSQWVVYTSGGNDAKPEDRTIWKVPIGGGQPVQLTTEPSFAASVSPDGRHFACRFFKADDSSPWKTAVVPIEGGPPTKFFDDMQSPPLRWTPDGAAITYVKTQNSVSNIWSQPLNGEPPRRITDFTTEQISHFEWSKDGRLVFSRGQTTMDAVLISNFR